MILLGEPKQKRQTPKKLGICLSEMNQSILWESMDEGDFCIASMGDYYLTSMFFVAFSSSLGASFGILTVNTPFSTLAEIFSWSASSGKV